MTAGNTEKHDMARAGSTHLARVLAGSVLLWLAFPPVGWSALAWVAPGFWLLDVVVPRLPGRRPYRVLWLAGCLFWLLALHWIRLPHPLNYLAWLALAGYLGIYLPVFVALARVAVWGLGLPLWAAAPVVWTGLDWLRGHLMTGFLMGSLAHTQVQYPAIIQIADMLGEYGVTFLIVLVAASLTSFATLVFSASRSVRSQPPPNRLRLDLLPGLLALAAALFYGFWQTGASAAKTQAAARIALIQGNALADWKTDPDRQRQIMAEYLRLSLAAVKQSHDKDGRSVDLVVWPETMFRQTLITLAEGFRPPPELVHESLLSAGQKDLAELTRQLGTAVLVGIDRQHLLPPDAAARRQGMPVAVRSYNSSVLVDKQGNILGTYDKMHRVPFGEYIPFADWFPSLYRLTPLTGGIQPGEGPAGLELGGVTYSANICYETVLPHLIRRQVAALTDRDQAPDVLVNLTNDAWFWGSSELDMHLACGVFRAVEMRTPLVIAANGGLSAYVDPSGRVLQVAGRQKTATLLVDLPVRSDPREYPSFYAAHGDWFAWICVLCCMVLAVIASRAVWRGDWQHSAIRNPNSALPHARRTTTSKRP